MRIAAEQRQLLGTIIEIKLPEQNTELFEECFAELERIEMTYSRFREDSELSILNKKLGTWCKVSDEFIYLLSKANEFWERTDGHFDITVKEVLDSLGYDSQYSFQAKEERPKARVENSLEAKQIEIDLKREQVLLHNEIDFGGLGKGFALDKVKEIIESNGVDYYYINAGGDIFARNCEGKQNWEIILEHPDDAEMAIGKTTLNHMALAGSSGNRRSWGKHHHLINAKTRKPARGVKAIFVTAHSGIEADAYATALFTAGFEEGIELASRLPVEILAISESNKMYQSPGFRAEIFWDQ